MAFERDISVHDRDYYHKMQKQVHMRISNQAYNLIGCSILIMSQVRDARQTRPFISNPGVAMPD